MDGLQRTRPRRRAARAVRREPADPRHLPRPAARARRDGGGRRRRRARAAPRPRGPAARGPRAAHGLGRGRRPRRVLLRALVRRRDAVCDRVVGRCRRRGALGLVLRLSVPSRRRAASSARATSRRRLSYPSPAPDPVPRRGRRPRRQGRSLPGPARRRRPGRARRGLLGRRRRRARVPRREGDARGARDAGRARRARSPTGSRSRSRSAAACAVAEDGEELLAAGADKVAVNSAALERPELVTELASRLGSQAVVVAIDAERGRVRSRAGTTETGRARRRLGARGRRRAARARSC